MVDIITQGTVPKRNMLRNTFQAEEERRRLAEELNAQQAEMLATLMQQTPEEELDNYLINMTFG